MITAVREWDVGPRLATESQHKATLAVSRR